MNIDFELVYASSGDKGKDAAMECHRLRCDVCGGLQEGCTCPEESLQHSSGPIGSPCPLCDAGDDMEVQ